MEVGSVEPRVGAQEALHHIADTAHRLERAEPVGDSPQQPGVVGLVVKPQPLHEHGSLNLIRFRLRACKARMAVVSEQARWIWAIGLTVQRGLGRAS